MFYVFLVIKENKSKEEKQHFRYKRKVKYNAEKNLDNFNHRF